MAVRIRLPQPKDVFVQRNKIIAFVLAICLSISLICVPVSASSLSLDYSDFDVEFWYIKDDVYNIETYVAGSAPLTFTAPIASVSGSQTFCTVDLAPFDFIPTQQSISLTVLLPDIVYTGGFEPGWVAATFYGEYTSEYYRYTTVVSSNFESNSCRVGEEFYSSGHVFESPVVSPILNNDGGIIGFSLTGILAHLLEEVQFTFYADSDSYTNGTVGSITLTFPSASWFSLSYSNETPSVSPPSIVIDSLQSGDDYVTSIVTVDNLASTDSIYSFRADISSNDEVLSSVTSDLFSGPYGIWHVTKNNLTPETTYTLKYTLQENGVDTGVSVSQTFTTLPAVDSPVVDDTDSLSLLSAILAAINIQNDLQEANADSIIHAIGMCWIRLRYIEEILATIGLSPAETALRNSVSTSTQSYTEQVWGSDGAGLVGVTDSVEVLSSSKQMLNTGVSLSDFFGLFNTYSGGHWFSVETRNDLDTVSSPATYALVDDCEMTTYEKNLQEIMEFMGVNSVD